MLFELLNKMLYRKLFMRRGIENRIMAFFESVESVVVDDVSTLL